MLEHHRHNQLCSHSHCDHHCDPQPYFQLLQSRRLRNLPELRRPKRLLLRLRHFQQRHLLPERSLWRESPMFQQRRLSAWRILSTWQLLRIQYLFAHYNLCQSRCTQSFVHASWSGSRHAQRRLETCLFLRKNPKRQKVWKGGFLMSKGNEKRGLLFLLKKVLFEGEMLRSTNSVDRVQFYIVSFL